MWRGKSSNPRLPGSDGAVPPGDSHHLRAPELLHGRGQPEDPHLVTEVPELLRGVRGAKTLGSDRDRGGRVQAGAG
jgi:hypothetical protein